MNWKEFFDGLGLNGTRWQWRILRWEERWRGARESVRGKAGQVAVRHKFCGRCRALLGREEKECPHCGARAPSGRVQTVQRVLGLVLPSWCPAVTLLLVVNGGLFLLGALLYGWRPDGAERTEMLLTLGALVPRLFADGEWWRLVTYGYLHIGWMHLLFNLFALSQVGPVLEQHVGSARFWTLYTAALLAGGAADLVLRAGALLIIAGSSGALFGLIGFGVSYGHFRGGEAGLFQRNFFLRWALYGFLFGAVVGADNIAHAGGFLAGAAIGWLIEREEIHGDRFLPLWRVAAWASTAMTIGAFVWMAWVRGGLT